MSLRDILSRYWRGFQTEFYDPDPRSTHPGGKHPARFATVLGDFGLLASERPTSF